MFCNSFDFLEFLYFISFGIQFRDPLSFGIPDEPPCYVGQYASMSLKSHR